MKYLVNRETKEHIRYHEDCSVPLPRWDIVEADDEGWITWSGGKCPLPNNHGYDVKVRGGDMIDGQLRPQDNTWWGGNGIVAYRPILPAESKPEPSTKIKRFATVTDGGSAFIADFDARHASANIFDRLSAAVAASESIPALIAEINAMLPEGYSVTQTAQVMAEPETHPSWDEREEVNGFRVGDFVECISDRNTSDLLKEGYVYKVVRIQNGEIIFDENGPSWMTSRFKLYSRPVTK